MNLDALSIKTKNIQYTVVSSYDQEGDLHSLIWSRMLKAWKLAREKQFGDMIFSITIWIGSSRQTPQEDGCQLISITHFTQSTYVVSIHQSVHLINGAYTFSNPISVVQFKSHWVRGCSPFLFFFMPFKEHIFVNSKFQGTPFKPMMVFRKSSPNGLMSGFRKYTLW